MMGDHSTRITNVTFCIIVCMAVALVVSVLTGGTPFAVEKLDAGLDLRTDVDSYSHGSDPQLEKLIKILLGENPEIRAARARSRSQSGRVAQERSLPDPQLNYRFFARAPETRVGPQEQALELSQAVPWKGKRSLQAKRAEFLADSAAWQALDLERFLVAELKRVYFNADYLQEALTINEEEHNLLEKFERIALKRYTTGEGIQQNVVKVQTDITRLDDQRTELQEQLDAALRRIAEIVGRPGQGIALHRVGITIRDVEYDRAELEQAAVTNHPRIRAIEQRINSDRAWSRRRALESRPDFRFGLGYTIVDSREDVVGVRNPPEGNGKDIVSLIVGINLPIYRKRIKAGVLEAQESLRSNQELLATSQNRLRYLVQEALLRLESLEERSRLYDEVLIPQAGESLASAEAAYTTGRQSFLDLLDAERVLFQVRLTYHRLLSDYWIALSDVEFSVGERFP